MKRLYLVKHRGRSNALVGCLIVLAACSAIAQQGGSFKARLSTVPVDATMLPTVTGSGSLKAVLTGNKLTISGSFEGLRSPAIRASIHIGPQKGMRGPAVHDLMVTKDKAGDVSGSVDLTSSEIEDLRSGRLYVQIDSERAPEGNLWGWVLR
jgi:CHRD domain-containing protein